MGQTLSEPITAKQSSSLQNKKLKVGASSMQGWRISMEDAHTHILTMSEDRDASFFAVYDGHGGSKIASHVSKHLHKYIVRRPEYKKGNYKDAMIKGFLECDEAMKTDESLKDEMSGSTGIAVLFKNNKFYVGNVGDSRGIACVSGVAEPLSTDHKPCDILERERIERAGGFVEFNRVNGNLALSRAFGDFAFKNSANLPAESQVISVEPEVVEREQFSDWQFVVLACDGIWDVLSNQQVVDFVVRRIAQGLEPEVVCEELMNHCLASDCSMGGLGCDNMTVQIICCLHNQPYQKLVDECAAIVKMWESQRKALQDSLDANEAMDDDEDESNSNDLSQESQENGGKDAEPKDNNSDGMPPLEVEQAT